MEIITILLTILFNRSVITILPMVARTVRTMMTSENVCNRDADNHVIMRMNIRKYYVDE